MRASFAPPAVDEWEPPALAEDAPADSSSESFWARDDRLSGRLPVAADEVLDTAFIDQQFQMVPSS